MLTNRTGDIREKHGYFFRYFCIFFRDIRNKCVNKNNGEIRPGVATGKFYVCGSPRKHTDQNISG